MLQLVSTITMDIYIYPDMYKFGDKCQLFIHQDIQEYFLFAIIAIIVANTMDIVFGHTCTGIIADKLSSFRITDIIKLLNFII